MSAIQQISEEDEQQPTTVRNDLFLQSLIATRPRPQTSKANRARVKGGLHAQKSSLSIGQKQQQVSKTLENYRMHWNKREGESGSPTQKYSTYSAVNSVGNNQAARNYICTSYSIKANPHDRRMDSDQSPLNPSIDQSQQHNLAHQYLQGIPSYLDQLDVRKLIQDKKQQLKAHAHKASDV